jgi:hypothetical protein
MNTEMIRNPVVSFEDLDVVPEAIEVSQTSSSLSSVYEPSSMMSVPQLESSEPQQVFMPGMTLPEGWAAYVSPGSEHVYYFNANTQVSSWTPPEGTIDAANENTIPNPASEEPSFSSDVPQLEIQDIVQGDWTYFCAGVEHPYYYNTVNGDSRWDPPPGWT